MGFLDADGNSLSFAFLQQFEAAENDTASAAAAAEDKAQQDSPQTPNLRINTIKWLPKSISREDPFFNYFDLLRRSKQELLERIELLKQ